MSNSAAYLVIKSSRRRRTRACKEASVCVGARGLTLTAPLCLCVVRSEAARRAGAAPRSRLKGGSQRLAANPPRKRQRTGAAPQPDREWSGTTFGLRGNREITRDLKKIWPLLCQRLLNCVGELLRNPFVALNIPT